MKVLFAEYLTWNTPFRVGSHYYAHHFITQGWEVGWLGGEFHPFNLVQNRAELGRKWPIWRSGGLQHPHGPWEYTALKLAPYRNWGPLATERLAWEGARWTVPSVRRMLAHRGFDGADLLWLTNPQAYPWLIDEPGYRTIVYRAADDHTARGDIPASIAQIEARIVERADITLATSTAVQRRLSAHAPERVYYLPNGVSLDRFARDHARPAEYHDINAAIAVYVGGLDERVDLPLLTAMASERADITWVFIGQSHVRADTLLALPNVRFLGTRRPEEIPAYLQHAQVGLIPFVRTPLTDATHSIKLYEYLAAGLPTVCRELSEMRATGAPAYYYTNQQSFGSALDMALTATETDKSACRAFAARNTWDARYDQVDSLLAQVGCVARAHV